MEYEDPPPLPPRSPIAWPLFEQHLIQAMLDFANHKQTPFKESQGEHFAPFTGDLWLLAGPAKSEQLLGTVWTRPGPWFVPEGALGYSVKGDGLVSDNVEDLTLDRPQEPRDAEEIYPRWRKRLSDALTDIVNEGRVDPRFQSFLDDAVRGTPLHLDVIEGALVYRFSIASVRAGWSLGLLMLLNSDYPLRRCLKCEEFFAVFDPLTRSRTYCLNCADDNAREKRNARVVQYRKSVRLIQKVNDGQEPEAACADLGLDVAVLDLPRVAKAIAKPKRSEK